MKLKELITRFEKLELIVVTKQYLDLKEMLKINDVPKYIKSAKLMKYDKSLKLYGDLEVLSIKDYYDTKTTSVILKEK